MNKRIVVGIAIGVIIGFVGSIGIYGHRYYKAKNNLIYNNNTAVELPAEETDIPDANDVLDSTDEVVDGDPPLDTEHIGVDDYDVGYMIWVWASGIASEEQIVDKHSPTLQERFKDILTTDEYPYSEIRGNISLNIVNVDYDNNIYTFKPADLLGKEYRFKVSISDDRTQVLDIEYVE